MYVDSYCTGKLWAIFAQAYRYVGGERGGGGMATALFGLRVSETERHGTSNVRHLPRCRYFGV